METQAASASPDGGTTRALSDSRFISSLTKNSYAFILAGGRGSRLKQLTDWRAKPAVSFGGKFRIIDFTLSNCVNSGIRRIGIATQYKAHSLIQHIQRGWSFLDGRFDEYVQLLPAQQQLQEEFWYRGTADAVFQNLHILRRAEPEYIVILSGDHIYKMDYGRMLAQHVLSNADLTIACMEVPLKEASAFGVVTVNGENRIVDFAEKPSDPKPVPGRDDVALASMGVYVFNADFLYEQLVRDADDRRSSHDFGKDIIPHVMRRYRTYAHRFSDSCVGEPDTEPYWRDVGTIDAYWEANMELTKITPVLNLYDRQWPIWTHQEHWPPAKFVLDQDDRRGMAVDSLVSGGCIISGATVRRSLLFSNVRVHSYSVVEDSVILPDVEINRNALVRRAVLDRGCVIPDGMEIGIDHALDRERGFHVSEGGVVLVTPTMLKQQDVYHIR
jgi:glucose-1-phosphate adenylyltransferase